MLTNNGKDADRENVHMYRITSNVRFINGRKFDNLAEAVRYARERLAKGDVCCDVMRVIDGKPVFVGGAA
jgi:hypothetical protein